MHSCVATDHYRHAPHEQSPAAAPRHPIDHSASAAAATGKRSQSHLADGAYTALKWPTGSGNGAECMYMLCGGSAKAVVAPDSMLDAENMTRWASEKQQCNEQ